MKAQPTQPFLISSQKNKSDKEEIYSYNIRGCAIVHELTLDTTKKVQHLAMSTDDELGKNKSSVTIKEDEWFNSEQAAVYLKVSKKTLMNMTSNGRIPYCKLGRSNRYSKTALERLLLNNKRGANYGD